MYSSNSFSRRSIVLQKVPFKIAFLTLSAFFLLSQNLLAQDIVAGSSVIVLKARTSPAPKKAFGNTAPKSKKAVSAKAKPTKNAKTTASKASKTDKSDSPVAALRTVSAGIVNARSANLPKPVYPAAARMVKASGAVNVEIVVDENGDVISAEAISGHALLRAAAVNAARAAQFEPVVLNGQPVRVRGIIVYNFAQ